MKGDFTRMTFHPENHFSRVLMQQGRVQLDSDWNEQADVTAHRVETETKDVVGLCGAPMHDAAFGIHTDPNLLDADDLLRLTDQNLLPLQAGDFLLTRGRFYVDGILVENEHAVPFTAQPNLPEASPIGDAGDYLAYLDVWERHITSLEDPSVREVALGGPDTATRAQVIWQVGLLPANDTTHCLSPLTGWDEKIAGSTGKLSARAQPDATSTDPCIVPATAGYRGLQNQLYRVEIHKPGKINSATFKWSRENGSPVFAIDEFIGGQPATQLRMRSLGRDQVLGLHKGDWVEVLDDDCELTGAPGLFLQITDIDQDELILTLGGSVSGLDETRHPKVRRWDSEELTVRVAPNNQGFLALEDGVEIHFHSGSYHTGDYWLIPARTILGNPLLTETGGIEWPLDPTTGDPLPQPPVGIEHHFCRLAILHFDGATLSAHDCRPLFPPLTELTGMFYVSGDGQEAMPGQSLPEPLVVGVSNGHWPVEGARVCFKVLAGSGTIQSPGATNSAVCDLIVLTDPDGLASCTWQLDNSTLNQRVEATLLDDAGNAIGLPVIFNANLSVASQVAYDPHCAGLAEVTTVQDALDKLCANAMLLYVGGDGQEGKPKQRLPRPLEVRLTNGQWPMVGENVIFEIVDGGGKLAAGGPPQSQPATVVTDADGYAAVEWVLGSKPSQQVKAFWEKSPNLVIHFNANLDEGGGTTPPQEPVFHIMEVVLNTTGGPLENNTFIPVGVLAEGFRLVCDEDIHPQSVDRRPVCYVTLDMPYPFTNMDIDFWGPPVIGFQPLILDGEALAQGNSILWIPSENAKMWLFERLFQMLERNQRGEFVRCHLTAKGNFIFARNEELYLDGETLVAPDQQSPSGLRLPSGDDKRGGDFEMWFQLVRG